MQKFFWYMVPLTVLWFAVMLGSAAGLMFLLLLMRRKGEENETA